MSIFSDMENALVYAIRILDTELENELYVLGLEDNIREEVSVHNVMDELVDELNIATEYNDDVFAVAFKVWRESDKDVVDRLLAEGVARITSEDLANNNFDEMLDGAYVYFTIPISLETDTQGKYHLV